VRDYQSLQGFMMPLKRMGRQISIFVRRRKRRRTPQVSQTPAAPQS
jgi:hypothetical protein